MSDSASKAAHHAVYLIKNSIFNQGLIKMDGYTDGGWTSGSYIKLISMKYLK